MIDELLARCLAEPHRETRLDLLSKLIVEVRGSARPLGPDDAIALFEAQNEEAMREEFDGAAFDRLWELISYAPAHERTTRVARIMIDKPRSFSRGAAARYLLRNSPDEKTDLLAKVEDDPGADVHNAVALQMAEADPVLAKAHWERALGCDPLPPELAEVIPYYLSTVADEADLARYEHLDRGTGRTIWGDVAALTRQRLGL